MIGGMGGIFADSTYWRTMRELRESAPPPTAEAVTAGKVTSTAVTLHTGNPILGAVAGAVAKGIVNELTQPSSPQSPLSQASLPPNP